MRLVNLLPSVPASGESLTMNDMVTVGGSIGWAGIGVSFSSAQKVSATEPCSRPALETMSPASPSSIGWGPRPRAALVRRALGAGEGENLRAPPLLDEPAGPVQRLDGLVRPDAARRDAPRD